MQPRHGHASFGGHTPEYSAWAQMIARCTRVTHPGYANYGGRGITVCARWRKFENFYADMGPRPEGMSLDRWPDNDGGYAPENCRWATRTQQARNQRTTTMVTIGNVTKPLAEWCEERGLNRSTVRKRVSRRGISYEQALA